MTWSLVLGAALTVAALLALTYMAALVGLIGVIRARTAAHHPHPASPEALAALAAALLTPDADIGPQWDQQAAAATLADLATELTDLPTWDTLAAYYPPSDPVDGYAADWRDLLEP